MEKKNELYAERLLDWCMSRVRTNRVPLISGVTAGLLAYVFAFTNKLVNHDEVGSLFSKGTSISSGRWGLELMSLVMPDYSMPWIYGVISILLLTAAACVILRIFSVRGRIFRILLPGLIVTFPSMTGTFTYMFTAASFAAAFFLSVLSVYFLECRGRRWLPAAFGCLILSLGIYQSYIAVAASLLVVAALRRLIDGEEAKPLLRRGMGYVLFLGICLVVYYLIAQTAMAVTGDAMNTYAEKNLAFRLSDLPGRFADAYLFFFAYFIKGTHGLIPTALSRVIHALCCGIVLIELIRWARSEGRKASRIALALLLLALLPLSINCLFLFAVSDAVHTLVLYSFVSVYVLTAVVMERGSLRLTREAVAFAMAAVLAINTYVANETFLYLHLQYEKTYAFYSNVITRVTSMPGFEEGKKIALVGSYSPPEYDAGQFGEIIKIQGARGIHPQIWSKYLFLSRYMGYELPFASQEEIDAVTETAEFAQMSVYPYYGSVRQIGELYVVRLE